VSLNFAVGFIVYYGQSATKGDRGKAQEKFVVLIGPRNRWYGLSYRATQGSHRMVSLQKQVGKTQTRAFTEASLGKDGSSG
jgi:hypothetical protein